ncbi:response regulator transcription factor [Mucilaginibacter psychrotolerans]|nr:response regulator transcription factor [Mucilaginibacter psychrotolerans]
MIKILLAEGHTVVRNGIKSLLEKETDIAVIAEVGDAESVLKWLTENPAPDIVLTAINFPKMGGIELTAEIKQLYPAIKVLILSRIDEEKHILQTFKAGAMGYLLKSVHADELIFGLRQVANSNQRYLCNEIALKLLDKLLQLTPAHADGVELPTDISKREIEVLVLISQGFTNEEVAGKLFTSKRTIESHRQSLINKTGTRNTAALVRYAVLNQIIG